MTSIILAGGKGLRFGQNKALETISGKSLLQWVVDSLAAVSTEIIIVTLERACFASFAMTYPLSSRIRVIGDVYPGKGPLGGIYSGLVTSSCLRAIVVGCDMPFLNAALLEYMTQISSGFDIIIPRTRKGVEPLCAIYSKNCLASIHRLVKQNELRISELFNMAKVKYVGEDEIDKFDAEHLSFFNINTKADLDKARKLAFQKGLANAKY